MQKDILIIGGGPSGLSTALHLQATAPELAARILVLEKAHYPRPKPCAGGLVADAEIILQKLGLEVSEIPHIDGRASHFDFKSRGLTIRVPGKHSLRIIRREEFDAWLATKARERGIEIREEITVKAVKPDSSGVTVETDAESFHAKIIVGADGSTGIVRRSVLPQEPVCTARVLEVLAPPNTNRQHAGQDVYFDFSPIPHGIAGYTWDFPTQVKGQPMRCWGIYDSNILTGSQKTRLKETLAAEMERFGYNLAKLELQGYPIRWFDPFNRISVPRVLLVGDAAGADPIFGEGISMALGYGKVAAMEVVKAFEYENFTMAGYRRRLLLSPLGQSLTARWLIAFVVYSLRWEWFQTLLWQVLKPVVILTAWVFVLNWARRMR